MAGYSGQQKEAADLAAAFICLGPLHKINESIKHATKLCPSVEGFLRERFLGVPQLLVDPEAGKYFIASPFNKSGESYRSPWTNTWLPPITAAAKPAAHLWQLGQEFNAAYDAYRDAHYGGGVSSVYAWPLQNQEGFAAAFLLLKEIPFDEEERPYCFFFHRLEVTLTATNAYYRVHSSLLLHAPCPPSGPLKGGTSALLSRSVEQTQKVLDARAAATAGSGAPMGPLHIAVGGPLIEKNEALLLDAAATTLLPRATQVCKDLCSSEQPNEDMLQLMKELATARIPSLRGSS